MRYKNFTPWIWALVGLILVSQSLFKVAQSSQDNFAIIVLPDTQHYSRSYPDIYVDQTKWIVGNKDALNIVYVAHEGDIVDDWDQEYQWMNAEAAMGLLEDPLTTGCPDGLPYGVLPGNHDQPTTLYNEYFGVNRFQGRGYYGGHYPSGSNDNNFVLFSAAGMDFIVINIKGFPQSAVLDWADARLKEYSDRRAIVVSHYLINTDGSFGGSRQIIYDALRDNANLFLMLCGHAHGEAMRLENYSGNTVHILLANYQELPNGGNGWLRIMEFSPASDEIIVRTYSPTLDQYGTDTVMGDNTTSQEFTISYDFTVLPAFTDVPPGFWAEDYIYAILNAGITKGCSLDPPRYCPTNTVNRAQMAAFIVRAVEGEPSADYCDSGSPFSDISTTHPMCKYIKRLSELGITTGYSDGTYRPALSVNRAQMAAFIVRAVEGEPAANYCDTGSPFTDIDPSFPMCKYIKRLFELGITTGYSDGTYRPTLFVNRTQMAAFLARAFLGMN